MQLHVPNFFCITKLEKDGRFSSNLPKKYLYNTKDNNLANYTYLTSTVYLVPTYTYTIFAIIEVNLSDYQNRSKKIMSEKGAKISTCKLLKLYNANAAKKVVCLKSVPYYKEMFSFKIKFII